MKLDLILARGDGKEPVNSDKIRIILLGGSLLAKDRIASSEVLGRTNSRKVNEPLPDYAIFYESFRNLRVTLKTADPQEVYRELSRLGYTIVDSKIGTEYRFDRKASEDLDAQLSANGIKV